MRNLGVFGSYKRSNAKDELMNWILLIIIKWLIGTILVIRNLKVCYIMSIVSWNTKTLLILINW